MKCLQLHNHKTERQALDCDDEYCSKWIKFVELEPNPKTKVFSVVSKCDEFELGLIKWYPAWRHYCFFPTVFDETAHSDRCLLEISQFITKLNEEHKRKKKEM